MNIVELKRLEYNKYSIPGILRVSSTYFYALELPYKDNEINVSSIPLGSYVAKKRFSASKGYEVFELTDVPNRTYIQIHIGNTTKDIRGCILIGIEGARDHVSYSTKAFKEFMELVGDEDFLLNVTY
jgi:hypothetical protein